MLLCELIGGNDVNGIREGKVFVDGEELSLAYAQLSHICGNILLGEIDSSLDISRRASAYACAMLENDDTLDYEQALEIIEANSLVHFVCYSQYKVNLESRTLDLHAAVFE